MSIGPASPLYIAAGAPLAQARGAAAERAAQAAEAHARLVDGQQRSGSTAQVDGTMGDNSVTDEHESARETPRQTPPERSAGEAATNVGPPLRDNRLDGDLGAGLDLTA